MKGVVDIVQSMLTIYRVLESCSIKFKGKRLFITKQRASLLVNLLGHRSEEAMKRVDHQYRQLLGQV